MSPERKAEFIAGLDDDDYEQIDRWAERRIVLIDALRRSVTVGAPRSAAEPVIEWHEAQLARVREVFA